MHQRLAAGAWTPVLQGIYTLSSSPRTWSSWAWAGTLSAGPAGVLIAGSAAGIRGWTARSWPVTIAVPKSSRVRWATPRLKCVRLDVPVADVVCIEGLPVTTRLRTAVDIAHLLPLANAQELLERLLVLGAIDLDSLTDAIRSSRRRGCRQARRLVDSAADRAASEAERMTQKLFRSEGLAWFVPNYPLVVAGRGLKIDLAFVRERVAIEAKGVVAKVRQALAQRAVA